jgi:hypothetical protein
MQDSRAPRTAALFPLLCLSGLFAANASPAARGEIVVSLSGDVASPHGAFGDEECLVVAPGGTPRHFCTDDGLAFYFGDRNGDGVLDVPNDVDALAFLPPAASSSGAPALSGLVFSMLADQAGIKDGDIVRLAPEIVPQGLEVLYSEGVLVAALEVNDGNIDVDAIAIAPDGTLLFSLAEDESLGAAQVVAQDETIFALAPGATQATVLYDAATIEQIARTALGITTPIGDVTSLEWDGGELLFTVLSPTANDATILSTAGGGTVWQGATEASFGFGVEVEIDALALRGGTPFPAVDVDPSKAVAGTAVTVRGEGFTPGGFAFFALSGVAAPLGVGLPAPGFGAVVTSPADPVFLAAAAQAGALLAPVDPTGRAMIAGPAPDAGGLAYDLIIQAYDTASGRFSHPVALELNQ